MTKHISLALLVSFICGCCSHAAHDAAPAAKLTINDPDISKEALREFHFSDKIKSSYIDSNVDIHQMRRDRWVVVTVDGQQIEIRSLDDLRGYIALDNEAAVASFVRLASSDLGRRLGFSQLGWEIDEKGDLFSTAMKLAPEQACAPLRSPTITPDGNHWKITRMIVVPGDLVNTSASLIYVEEIVTRDGKYKLISRKHLCTLPASLNFSMYEL